MTDHAELEFGGLDFTLERDEKLYKIRVDDQDGFQAGRCRGYVEDCSFNGTTIKAMFIGMVMTRPEYRRGGIARKTFEMLDPVFAQTGALVSYLHPFSFPYYRAMGYERVSDHRVLEFAITDLDFVPRYPELKRLRLGDDMSPLDQVYNAFSRGRNVMQQRYGSGSSDKRRIVPEYMQSGPYLYDFSGGKQCYLSRDRDGQPDGYIIFHEQMPLQDHYLKDGIFHVDEMCFVSPLALKKLLGFIRMHEGQHDRVRIANCGMAPEIERMLRRYKYTNITVLPDVAARVHDVGGLLAASTYPKEPGAFTVRVKDSEKSPFRKDLTEGVWQVTYGDGVGRVTRLEEDAPYDLCLHMPAFTQLVHGYENFGSQVAKYMDGVELVTDCEDFFRAFPNRPAGSFDLF